MSTFGERLRDALKKRGVKSIDLADSLGVSKSTVSFYLSDRTFPNKEFFVILKRIIPDLNLNWLLTGIGQEFEKSIIDSNAINIEVKALKTRERELTDALVNMSRLIAQPQAQQSKLKGVLNTGNFLQIGGRIFCAPKHTVIGTPQFTH